MINRQIKFNDLLPNPKEIPYPSPSWVTQFTIYLSSLNLEQTNFSLLSTTHFFLIFFFWQFFFYCPFNIILSLMPRLGSPGIIKLIFQIVFLLHNEETFLNKYTDKHPLCYTFIQYMYMCTVFFKIKCYKHGSNNETV